MENNEINLANYKAEELQMRNGNVILFISKNTTIRRSETYLVVYSDKGGVIDSVFVYPDGRLNDFEECGLDIIPKPKKIRRIMTLEQMLAEGFILSSPAGTPDHVIVRIGTIIRTLPLSRLGTLLRTNEEQFYDMTIEQQE